MSYYPTPYQPYPTQNSSFVWVNGEHEAKTYPVQPNSSVMLLDQQNEMFYVKSADSSGMPHMRTYEYHEVISTPEVDTAGFATKEDIQKIHKRLDQLMNRREKNDKQPIQPA